MLLNSQQLIEVLDQIEEQLDYRFSDRKLLYHTFIHSSFYHEHPDEADHSNERMEFFGDSIFGLLVSEYLFRNCPNMDEGALTHMRSLLVSAEPCIRCVEKLGISRYLLVGRAEKSGHSSVQGATADLLEAVIAAIYLDGGLTAAREFLFKHFTDEIDATIASPPRHWKIELHQLSQSLVRSHPIYRTLDEKGPEHEKQFYVGVWIGERCWGEGWGSNKKEAQQEAARHAMLRYQREGDQLLKGEEGANG